MSKTGKDKKLFGVQLSLIYINLTIGTQPDAYTKISKKYMRLNNIKSKKLRNDIETLFWFRNRLEVLNFGLRNKVKTDNSLDFEMLERKYNSYKEEYDLLVDKLYSYLKNDNNLQQKTDYLREEG
jgi:hypothetical protein